MTVDSASAREYAGVEHHPACRRLQPITTLCPAGFDVDFIGTKTQRRFYAGTLQDASAVPRAQVVTSSYPPFDEEYFEWIDISSPSRKPGIRM